MTGTESGCTTATRVGASSLWDRGGAMLEPLECEGEGWDATDADWHLQGRFLEQNAKTISLTPKDLFFVLWPLGASTLSDLS